MQNSNYCTEENEAFLSIAGHYDIYQDIFAEHEYDNVNVYDTIEINKKLYSHYPYPEFGGTLRRNNTLILGSKFETKRNAHERIYSACSTSSSQHNSDSPFFRWQRANLRAFMNTQLIRAGMLPVYIRVKDKKEYIQALEKTDKTGDYRDLYELIFRLLIRSYVELSQQ